MCLFKLMETTEICAKSILNLTINTPERRQLHNNDARETARGRNLKTRLSRLVRQIDKNRNKHSEKKMIFLNSCVAFGYTNRLRKSNEDNKMLKYPKFLPKKH